MHGTKPMNENHTMTVTDPPLHILLRRRREELSLLQADIAAAPHVSPECVTMWEAGRRRMELCQLLRIAAALHIDGKQLCAKALAEFHPAFYDTLFSSVAKTIRQL